ncbi:MAG: hypothetical protein WBA28_02775 [Microbacteriaceae bacterium]
MSEREELICILDTEGAQSGDCGHEPGSIADCPNECREILEGYADAILAAGYRKPRMVTTVEQVEALPSGAVVRGDDSAVTVKKTSGAWFLVGVDHHFNSGFDDEELALPAKVLYEGSE